MQSTVKSYFSKTEVGGSKGHSDYSSAAITCLARSILISFTCIGGTSKKSSLKYVKFSGLLKCERIASYYSFKLVNLLISIECFSAGEYFLFFSLAADTGLDIHS